MKSRLFQGMLVLLLPALLQAKILGVYGQVFPIAEMDFLQFIHARLMQVKTSGGLVREQAKFKARVLRGIDRPPSVTGITATQRAKIWLFDPSITVAKNLVDTQGRLVAFAGQQINPLSRVSLRQPLLFLDADKAAQRRWAKKIQTAKHNQVMLILVNGSLSSTVHYFKRRVYFDQGGRLVHKFHITHTPAIVTQHGLQLKIREIVA